jgi:putative endonuclease
VYVLRNPEGRLYIGFTTDLPRSLRQHQGVQVGWTEGKGPWKLTLHEEFEDRAPAMRREKALKSGDTDQELLRKLSSPSL